MSVGWGRVSEPIPTAFPSDPPAPSLASQRESLEPRGRDGMIYRFPRGSWELPIHIPSQTVTVGVGCLVSTRSQEILAGILEPGGGGGVVS